MRRYLLDTNAFFEMLGFLAGRNVRPDAYDFEEIMQGECYISKITELEILSVIGKYGRGAPSQWQNCNRQIAADGTKCTHQFFQKGCKPWNKRLCTHMRKLVKEMIDGTSPIITLHVLDIAQDIIDRAEGFMMHAVKYKFGAQDALIAATAIAHSGAADPLFVVTSDRALMAAMKEEGIDFIVPGITISDS
ncbi:hypothetical protein IMSAGC015_02282 [Lachnospiraceae bacterium]|jgi:predicted nucleic acid-binding protein|nr:hypothetical protein IMSAGC015_02282 [Lachnospiraceae bacterium]